LLAQQTRTHSQGVYLSAGDTLQLPHAFLAPFSEQITDSGGRLLPRDAYTLVYSSGLLIAGPHIRPDSNYHIRYRYFVHPLKQQLALRSFHIRADSSAEQDENQLWRPPAEKSGQAFFWETSDIQKSGSLSRGLTLGNNRSVSLSSGLRLQLEGDLGGGLKVVGAITDENIPIQPDGTTQQINDLDKVFVKLMKDDYSLTIGDYELSQQGTRFANYYRNVQGLRMDYDGPKTSVSLSAAVAKGKFHSNSLQGKEGIAGPYQLTGKNGERFFFVLAGSERVYLNGKLMKRGENQDYIIDYNTASITFTSKHVITSVSRIVVDFEYNDQHYNRSLMVAGLDHRPNEKFRLRISYARDADNPNAPFDNAEAYQRIRDSLRLVGDEGGAALTSSVEEAGFSAAEGQTRYLRRDTLINGRLYERYVFSTDSAAVYKISFSFVGQGQGFYTRDFRGVNRVIYKWVPPAADGSPQGDYAPLRQWVLPRLLQVLDAGLHYQLNDHMRLYSETALSAEDLNRLSSLDDDDNLDLATRSGLAVERIRLADSLQMSVDVNFQYVGRAYTNLDRVYQAEYNRQWNLEQDFERRDERIGQARVGFSYKNKLDWQVDAAYRNVGEGRTAYRQVYRLSSSWPRWLQGNYSFTHIANNDLHAQRFSRWLRHEGEVYQPLGKLRLGVELWAENRSEMLADTSREGSFSFLDLTPFLRTAGTRKFVLDASVNYRRERAFWQGKKREKSLAYTYYLKYGFTPSKNFQFQHTFSLRDFRLRDTAFAAQGLSNTRLIQTNLQARYLNNKRGLSGNLLYEVRSEGVARRDLMFIEVNPGQGQYEYIGDFNGNGVQDLDEFQLSTNPLVANYVRVLIPSRELFPTTKLNLSGSLRLEFSKMIPKGKKGLLWLWRNTRMISQFRLSQNKSRSSGLGSFLINVADVFADTTLLDATSFFRQDLSFFPNHPVGELKFAYLDNQSKLFLSTGTEVRSLSYWRFHQRLNLGSKQSLEHELRTGRKRSLAENFESRNFHIRFIQSEPRFNLQFNRKFRFSSSYTYIFKQNFTHTLEKDAKAHIHKFSLESNWNFQDRNRLMGRLELVNVNQQGEASFSGQYELREGLQQGFNAIWQLMTAYRILANVELNLTYDGRAAVGRPVVHTGRIQLRAFF